MSGEGKEYQYNKGGACESEIDNGDADTVTEWKWEDPVTRKDYTGHRKVVVGEKLQEQRRSLPIYKFKEEFLSLVKKNQIVIVVGETGSGKSTQMPQYMRDAGLVKEGSLIACTQPRRIATVALAQRVAEERSVALGGEVGYAIRFEDVTSDETVIKYMTDGMLCMAALRDKELSQYGAVIIDEAHERTVHSDVLLALVKKALKARPELKVVVTSATLDSDKLSRYFDCCPVLNIPGFMFPVDIVYCKSSGMRGLVAGASETEYLKRVVEKVKQIHLDNVDTEGILVFLPGTDEIAAVSNSSLKTMVGLHIITLHAAMPVELQALVFTATPNIRKLVLATNVAETTLTIPGIKYVVDSGYFKENTYDPHGQMDRLVVTPVSCAQATQRAGRAGRVGPGVCYRMYGEKEFKEMRERPTPAICRTDIVTVCLLLKAIGIKNIITFGFLDPPVSTLVQTALTTLMRLDALDNQEVVTPLGMTMSDFPLSPVLAKMLVSSVELGCSEQVLTVVAMLSVKNVFIRKKKSEQNPMDEERLRMARLRLSDSTGDHLTMLNVFEEWVLCGCSPVWSATHSLSQKELERAFVIRDQLASLMTCWFLPLLRVPRHQISLVLQAVCAGVKAVDKVATLHWSSLNYVRTKDMMNVWIHPGSILFSPNNENQPRTIIYHEIVTTTKNFMRQVSAVKPEWVKN